jgi:UDP-N-acetylglucosamine 4,6-dehydratase (inverting)
MLKNKTLLITGGTGSLGKALTKEIFKRYIDIGKLIVFSRDEQKHFQMREEFPIEEFPKIKFVLGDVRDYESIKSACKGVDYIIHAAAMKHVHLSEMNPDECIKTNVNGAQNIIKAVNSIDAISYVVALSTDKACAPVNLYGATKLTSDKLFIAANQNSINKKFSVVRYGNVMSSNGSVIPFFLKKKKTGTLPITDPEMTRFNITLKEGVNMVLYALENAWGGELFVPKIPSYNIMDLAKAVDSTCKIKIIGIRPGEKVHEEMISSSDSYNTFDIGKYYVILPSKNKWKLKDFLEKFNAKKVPNGFNYNSKENKEFLSVEKLKKLIYSDQT